MSQNKRRLHAFIGMTIGWFAVIFQYYLMLNNGFASPWATTVNFFSYFTIQSNILVAICYTVAVFVSPTQRSFFTRPSTLTAIATYILIVGLVYNLVLRQLWSPTGMQKLVDELLHSVSPLLFIFYWIFFVRKEELQWRSVFPWMIYPVIYLTYTIVRGSVSGFYPYPFVNVKEIGLARVLINSLVLFGIFLLFSLLFVAAAKKMRGSTNSSSRLS